MKKAFSLFVIFGFACGCSTPQSRITKNQEFFNQLPGESQTLISQGQIEIGFDKPMVELAWGKPSKVRKVKTAESESESWIYSGYRTNYISQHHFPNYHHVYSRGHHCNGTFYSPLFSESREHQEYDKAKVHFEQDKVVSFESEE